MTVGPWGNFEEVDSADSQTSAKSLSRRLAPRADPRNLNKPEGLSGLSSSGFEFCSKIVCCIEKNSALLAWICGPRKRTTNWRHRSIKNYRLKIYN